MIEVGDIVFSVLFVGFGKFLCFYVYVVCIVGFVGLVKLRVLIFGFGFGGVVVEMLCLRFEVMVVGVDIV